MAKSTQQRDELRISIEARQHEKNEQDHKYSQLERQLKHANDRLDRVVRGLDEKRAAAKAKTEMLNAEYVRLSAEKKERMALVDTQNNESAELERQVSACLRCLLGGI